MAKSIQWRPVVGHEGAYSVSEYGDIWIQRLRRKGKLQKDRKGYVHYFLSENGVQKLTRIHRIVLEAFVGPCPQGMECCHKDNDPLNNHYSNLMWATHRDNMMEFGMMSALGKGESNGTSVLTDKTVKAIRKMAKETHATHREISERYGTTKQNIGRIINRKRWQHV